MQPTLNSEQNTVALPPVVPEARALGGSPETAEAARQTLEVGNERFARWMHNCRTHSLPADGPGFAQLCLPQMRSVTGGPGEVPRQLPFALVVGCSDARVPTEMVFGRGFNDLFVVRTAGNVIGTVSKGSIDYALTALTSSMCALVVLGHRGCGAVTATVDAYLDPGRFYARPVSPALREIIQRVFVAVRRAARALEDAWGPAVVREPGFRDSLLDVAVCLNAAQSALELRNEVEQLGLNVRVFAGVHDIATCRVRSPASGAAGEPLGLADAPSGAPALDDLAIQLARGLPPRS